MHTKPFDRMDGVKIAKGNHRSCSKKHLPHNPFKAIYKLTKCCMHTKRNRRSRSRMRLRLRHSLNETTANNPLPFLPEEIIVNILLRLPVKSLLQFKSVCKTWKALISHSKFVNNHLQISTTYPQLVASTVVTTSSVRKIVSYPVKQLFENPSTTIEPVSFSTGRDYHDIIGSCNGLLCMFHHNQFCVSLWNPSINLKSKRSPAIVSSYDYIVIYRGFGYDQLNDKYKVLVGVDTLDEDNIKTVTKIYTFGENSWKTLHNFPVNPRRYLGKFVSGTLNWILCKDGGYFNKEAILSFDLAKETYREMLLPQHDDGYGVCCQGLFVLSNCLCVCFDHSNEYQWAVWMMKEYGVFESWTKLMIIPHEKLLYSYGWQHPYVEPLFITENGVVLPLNAGFSQFILYTINNDVVDYLRTFGKAITLNLHIYHESLISPQRYFEVETNDKSK